MKKIANGSGPRDLQRLCHRDLGALAARDRRDGLRHGEHRDGQSRAEEASQNETDVLRRREGLRSHTAGSTQEEHGHIRPLVADPIRQTLPQSARVVLREQGERPRGVHHGAHRIHRVQGGQGPEDHFHPLAQWQRAPNRPLASSLSNYPFYLILHVYSFSFFYFLLLHVYLY